ncbi:hypothetical protein OSB04_007066 [Centaurea solstitialis]|uniref:Uncharacterized protein n=1 Tax=Centaurea solstitialis TaxID=347529 RepID=A0AA38WT29_9ASTR|nr:hypothetical protein OSB04_007066 [Centaurea solstitialis]
MADEDAVSHTPTNPHMGENDLEASHDQPIPNVAGNDSGNTRHDEDVPTSPRTERLMKMMADQMKSLTDKMRAALEEQRKESILSLIMYRPIQNIGAHWETSLSTRITRGTYGDT